MRHTHNGAGRGHRAPVRRAVPRRNPARLIVVAAFGAIAAAVVTFHGHSDAPKACPEAWPMTTAAHSLGMTCTMVSETAGAIR